MHKQSIYAKLYVPNSRRAKFTPRVGRKYRPELIAWHGPDPFFRNRFYELDKWYKARIQRPEHLPQLHIIDPDLFVETYEQKTIQSKEKKLNIGFKRTERELKVSPEERAHLEELAIKNQLLISLDRVDSANQLSLFEHFNIFEDLFAPGVFFYNVQALDICWTPMEEAENSGNARQNVVHFGNMVKAADTAKAPQIRIGRPNNRAGEGSKETAESTSAGAYNTLLMLNLEGTGLVCQEGAEHEQQLFVDDADQQIGGKPTAKQLPNAEEELLERLERGEQLLHWMVANIPDGSSGGAGVEAGEQMVPYMQPVPFHGTGYHRFAFLMFRHRHPIDFSAFALQGQDSLQARAFNTNLFYKKFEREMTPSALRFCQIKWDESSDRALHAMDLKSPRYWYEWNQPLKPEQKEFPMKAMPFDKYLDMYRSPESVRKEVRKKRIEMLVKLKPGEKLEPQKYPDIFYQRHRWELPEFVHDQLIKQNLGQGIYATLYQDYENPAEQHTMEKYQCQVQSRRRMTTADDDDDNEEEGEQEKEST